MLTPQLIGEFTTALIALHLGPGPHPDGSPQSVHAGGKAIPGPTRGRPAYIERGEGGRLQRQLAGGGFSYQPVGNTSPTTGFMVSPYSDREYKLPVKNVSARQLTTYLARNADLLTQPDHYIGGWVDGDTAYIDISQHVSTPDQARQLARQHRQLAFYDLAQGATVYV
jgi:hypothetical protein